MPEEDPTARLKRLRIRSWRRGTKEMDMILGQFADSRLAVLAPADLEAYDALLKEGDPDLFLWYCERSPAPDRHRIILDTVRRFHADRKSHRDGMPPA